MELHPCFFNPMFYFLDGPSLASTRSTCYDGDKVVRTQDSFDSFSLLIGQQVVLGLIIAVNGIIIAPTIPCRLNEFLFLI